ncbi:RagB/SusD family nutrient uptake outer membrane protein [Pedobacter heparinus]|uniref:RagB/SusD domain protein n=1 Tax=Pedobacter heparinus (strain ATCC 13125 / DSM 2366 / CIP 104194 / JCM 7457 / NBRC 12017 / NCIMB 9290 / NRRL B-14731 / HIM 762-3) TaxID=485917 RepID=C6Y0Y3_PEDHD|nr:RagB/SusD family nutrient uptake outer membrane protein [Pedobacter heparinus]ACU04910.1 RagB/SusD domain protein [Pedobacter heparinus DSM 2366]
MKKIYVKTMVLLMLGTLVLSCKKTLDTDPLSNPNTANFWKTEGEANKALIACYSKLKEPIISNGPSQSGNFLFWEALSDNASNTSNYESFDIVMRGDHNSATTGIVSKSFTFGFQGIAYCNYFMANIDRVPSMAEATRNRMKGEALFLRAFYYNDLAQLYGDLPLILKPASLDDDFKNTPRSPKADVVTQILKDLDLAISYLPATAYTDGRAVKGSAIALKTRVLLNNERFGEAATAAWSLIGDPANPFQLADSYSGIFFGNQANNKEIMFSVQFKAPDDYHSLDQVIGGRMSVFPTVELRNAYEPNDPRRKMTIFEANDPWAYNPGGFKQTGSTAEGQIPYTTMAFKKWVNTAINNASGATLSDQHMVKIRYADLLLMYAEAMFESGQGADLRALKALNDVRGRQGVNMPAKPALTREIIRNERRVELAFEGLRYNDLIRWKIAAQVIPLVPYDAKGTKRKFKSYLFPIPLGQMDIMRNVWTQNPDFL